MGKLQDIICPACGKLFHPKNRYTKYCCKRCSTEAQKKYSICEYCWKEFNNKHWAKFCSIECFNNFRWSYAWEKRKCEQCWNEFNPQNREQKFCCWQCQRKSIRILDDIECLECWKTFKPKNRYTKYCCRECQYKAKSKWNKIRWVHLSDEDKQKQIAPLFDYQNLNIISKINLEYKDYLESQWHKVELEKELWWGSFDLCLWDILIDINPFAYHNATWHPFDKPRDKKYHYEKLTLALNNWYRCIMVWDWDDKKKIAELVNTNKIRIWARQCILKQISYDECHSFFEENHIQWDTRKDKSNIYIGLYNWEKLIEAMSFWKPRQNKWYEREILRLCTLQWYSVSWWAWKIFSKFLESHPNTSVISYCDMSKFDWKVYEQLWFNLLKRNAPSKHWYNPKTKQHITDQLVRSLWPDKILGTDYWKWTDNDELMKQAWFVEIYDCGQATYVYGTKI